MSVDPDRLEAATRMAVDHLLGERVAAGHWVGELSTSALSTAVAAMALHQWHESRDRQGAQDAPDEVRADALPDGRGSRRLIDAACTWLLAHRNADGGWGDTVGSRSNVSTMALGIATLTVWDPPTENRGKRAEVLADARRWFDAAGGFDAVVARYGKDKTFSVPILTHCALAGLVPWDRVTALPFELATLPPRFYAAVRLPVVSYALPALIALGQLRHVKRPSRNPLLRSLRSLAVSRALERLAQIQPRNGGFLEAAPLTGFVLMSLSAAGRADHPVARRCVEFLTNGVREDGSWPIDTNLATWVTTLAVNALGDDLPAADRPPIRDWLLAQQFREVHPYTRAAPGGWAWTDQPGGVPDADDTPGAILALHSLHEPDAQARETTADRFSGAEIRATSPPSLARRAHEDAAAAAVRWLLDLQNRDGGVPTFCRGWGALPFDRSAPDLTAHAVRAWICTFQDLKPGGTPTDPAIFLGRSAAWGGNWVTPAAIPHGFGFSIPKATGKAFAYLRNTQRPDGAWLPLWFGNQHAPDDGNPVYGTARVLATFADCGLNDDPACIAGRDFLLAAQNPDGGWGGAAGCPSSVEETALATEILLRLAPDRPEPWGGARWLMGAVESNRWTTPAPIGFYFAKLWYSERLYPVIFTVQALRTARAALRDRGEPRHDAAPPAAGA